MAGVLVSFIHEEERVAEAVKQYLDEKLDLGQVLFMSSDQWQVYGGDDWLEKIRLALRDSVVIVALLSQESVRRPWVNFEAGAAWLTRKVRIPGEVDHPFRTKLTTDSGGS